MIDYFIYKLLCVVLGDTVAKVPEAAADAGVIYLPAVLLEFLKKFHQLQTDTSFLPLRFLTGVRNNAGIVQPGPQSLADFLLCCAGIVKIERITFEKIADSHSFFRPQAAFSFANAASKYPFCNACGTRNGGNFDPHLLNAIGNIDGDWICQTHDRNISFLIYNVLR